MTDDVIALTAALVATDSANPSLAPTGAGEAAVVDVVRQWARENGLATTVLGAEKGRPSVLVRGGRARGGRRLMICGHLDTVGHGGMAEPVTPRINGSRMYGRGAYDMKAGVAAALVACRDAAAAGIPGEVIVAAVADEEHSSIGVRQVLEHESADAAIVTEPTELEVAVAHKGFVWSQVDVIGRSAHGSRPHLGLDAIRMMHPVLAELDALDRGLTARAPHPLLGHGSVHASTISGGAEPSTIPAHCTLTLERRTLPGESAQDVHNEMRAILDRCAAADPRFDGRLRTVLARDPFQTPDAEPIVQTLLTAAHGTDGRTRSIVGVSYWSDAAYLAAAGIPTVLFGPSGDGAHADVEWVDIASIHTCTQVLTAAAHAFCD